MEDNIFGLKGLTRQDWEKWQSDYQKELEGYSDQEKEDLFVDVIFNEALDKDSRLYAFENSSREDKIKLYNYYTDELGPRQEEEALGLVPTREEIRERPFGELIDFFTQYPSEYTPEDIMERANVHEKRELNKQLEGEQQRNFVSGDPQMSGLNVQLTQQEVQDKVKESKEEDIEERLKEYEDFKYSDEDMLSVSVVQEAQRQMAATEDYNKKKEIFNKVDKDLEGIQNRKIKLQEALQNYTSSEAAKRELVKVFDELSLENDMYQQFKGTGKVDFTEDEKVEVMLDLYALQQSDYGSTAANLFNNAVQKKVVQYNEEHEKLENIGKGAWGFASTIAAVPAYLMGVGKAVEETIDGENFIDSLVDNEYMRLANDISQYGAKAWWNDEWLNKQKELAVYDNQLLRMPGQESDIDFTSSAFWGDMINQYGFTAASMILSGGTSLAGRIGLGTIKGITGAMYLNTIGRTAANTEKFLKGFNAISKVVRPLGTFSNIALTAGYETTLSTLQDKMDFLEQGTQEIQDKYAKNQVQTMEYIDKIQYMNDKGYQVRMTGNSELGQGRMVLEKDGKLIDMSNLDKQLEYELLQDTKSVIEAAENNQEIPEHLSEMAASLNKDMEYLSKTADIQARAGFITREIVYGTIAGTLKATLQSGSVQQALKNMGFGHRFGVNEQGKAFFQTHLPKFLQNKYGYGAVNATKEIGGEFIEEWEDVIASDFSKGIGNTYMSNYYKTKYEGASEEILKDQIGKAIIAGFQNVDLLSEEALSSGIYGALSAALGGVTVNNNIGNRSADPLTWWAPVTWRSSLFTGFREGQAEYEEIEQTVNAIQTWLDDPSNREKWDGAVGTVNWMERISSDMESKDEYMYRNDNLAKMIHDISILKKIKNSPIADQILEQIERASNADSLNEEEKKSLIEEYRNVLQNNPGSDNMSDEEVIQRIENNGQKMRDLYTKIDKEKDFLDSSLQDYVDEDLKESLIYGRILYEDLNERRDKMSKELSNIEIQNSIDNSTLSQDQKNTFAVFGQNGMNSTIIGYDKKIEEAKETLDELKSKKRANKKEWSEKEESELRRAKVELDKLKKLRRKALSKKESLKDAYQEETVLSEQDIMSLDADTRAFILDTNNKKNYSEKQRGIIDNVRNQLYRRSLERKDSRLYIDMVKDLAKTLVDAKAFEEYQFALQMNTQQAGVYARRFANKVKSDRIKSMAKNFSEKRRGTEYSLWKKAYKNITQNMSKQEQNLFDVSLMSQHKDPNMYKYLAEQGKKNDLLNFVNSKNLQLTDYTGRALPINTTAFEEIIDLIQNNNLDPTDLNNIQQIKENISHYESSGDDTQSQDFRLIRDNYEEIIRQYNDYNAELNTQRRVPQPKTQEKKQESPKDALDSLIDDLNKEVQEQEEENIFEGLEVHQDEEEKEYNIVDDETIISYFNDFSDSVQAIVSFLIESVNNNMAIDKADKDGNIKKAFKYSLQKLKEKKELGTRKGFLDAFEHELKNRNLGANTKQFQLLTSVLVNSARTKSITKDTAREYTGNRNRVNTNAQAINPMDVFSKKFGESENAMYLPYQLMFKQYGIEEFLQKAYDEGNIANTSTLIKDNIFFISDIPVETTEGTTLYLSDMLKASFASQDVEFKEEDSIPIIAVVATPTGNLIVKDSKGNNIRVQPVAVYPPTGSISGGSNELANFRKLAIAQRESQTEISFIKDEEGNPLQPLKEAPLNGKKSGLEAVNNMEPNSQYDVSTIMQNDMSTEEKEEFQNATEEEKKTILQKLKDRFFKSLGIGKSSKSGKDVLVYKGESNMKAEEATADIFVKTIEDTVNSEGRHLNEVEDPSRFNSRTEYYTRAIEETLTELDSELNGKAYTVGQNGIVVYPDNKAIQEAQKKLNSVLGKYINIPSIFEYRVNVVYEDSNLVIKVSLYNTATREEDSVLASRGIGDIVSMININSIFLNTDNSYRTFNNDFFAKWQVDYKDLTGESEWAKQEDNQQALWAMRNSIFNDNLLFSRRKTFKYRPVGLVINSPFKKAKKKLPPKKVEGDPDSGVGMPVKTDPDLVKERKEKLEALQEDARLFRQGQKENDELGVSRIAQSESRWLSTDINYHTSNPGLDTNNFIGQTSLGSIIYRKDNSIFIANQDGHYVEFSIGQDLSNIADDTIIGLIENHESKHIVLSSFKDSANDIISNLQVIGKQLIAESNVSTGEGGQNEINKNAAFKYGTLIDVMSRDCAAGKYDSLVEGFLAIPEDSRVERVEYVSQHINELSSFTNMTPMQAMNILADMHQKFKEAFNGHTILSEELLCRGLLEVRDSKGNKRHIKYRGLTDIVTIGPDGRVYVYDVKTFKQEDLSQEKLQQYYIQLNLYAKAIAEQLGIPPQDIVMGVIPIKLDYTNRNITSVSNGPITEKSVLYSGSEIFTLNDSPKVQDFKMFKYNEFYLDSYTMNNDFKAYFAEEKNEVEMEILNIDDIEEETETSEYNVMDDDFDVTISDNEINEDETLIGQNHDVNSDWSSLNKEQQEYLLSKGINQQVYDSLSPDDRENLLTC